jgi:hypothetical protein
LALAEIGAALNGCAGRAQAPATRIARHDAVTLEIATDVGAVKPHSAEGMQTRQIQRTFATQTVGFEGLHVPCATLQPTVAQQANFTRVGGTFRDRNPFSSEKTNSARSGTCSWLAGVGEIKMFTVASAAAMRSRICLSTSMWHCAISNPIMSILIGHAAGSCDKSTN